MRPRIFVSSTYYDLKHVRERIERFIENYYFDPVLFESDSVVFEHNKPLDVSCYNEVKLCHMMILIIGGRYGSIISGENQKERKDSYNKDFISITRREFETASKMNIPVFVFIEKNVYAEYQTFSKNKEFFESGDELDFSFAHVDDINVFKFINEVERVAIKTFERVEDIENYLGNQIAGMLFLYLQEMQNKREEDKILDSVGELKTISRKMNEMLNAVGEKLIGEENLTKVLNNQNKIVIDFFIDKFISNVTFINSVEIEDYSKDLIENIYKVFQKNYFDEQAIKNFLELSNFSRFNLIKKNTEKAQEELLKLDSRLNTRITLYDTFSDFCEKVYPLIKNNQEIMDYFEEQMIKRIDLEFGLPF